MSHLDGIIRNVSYVVHCTAINRPEVGIGAITDEVTFHPRQAFMNDDRHGACRVLTICSGRRRCKRFLCLVMTAVGIDETFVDRGAYR